MAAIPNKHAKHAAQDAKSTARDWRTVVHQIAVSRALDELEETRLLPEPEVLHQFWAALNIVTTERLPLLFFIEDNGYGISVPSKLQTPGGNIAKNLAAFRGLRVLDGDGSDPVGAAILIEEAVRGVRTGGGPALLRLTVPRLSGH